MVIFWFDSTLIAVFLFFAIALGYQAYLTVHGIIFAISIIILTIQAVLSIVILVHKAKQYKLNPKRTTLWDMIMTLVAVAACFFNAYIFATDIRSCDDGLIGMLCFIVSLSVCGGLWLSSAIECAAATIDEGFDYGSFLKEFLCFAILFVLAYVL